MNLIKTSVLNGISVAVKICSAIVINKVLALYVGPSGYSTFGQFQNILTIATSASGGVFLSGVIKETAENHNNSQLQHDVWATTIKVTLVLSLISGLILFASAKWVERVFFPQGGDMWPLFLVAVLLPSIAINSLFLSILNGMREISLYVLMNITSNIVIGILGTILIINYGLYGGLVALLFSPLIGTLLLSYKIKDIKWLRIEYFFKPINNDILKSIAKFSLMGITSAIMIPATAILIRSYLEKNYGISEAGYWQGVQKIGEIYSSILTITLSIYYLPRIAELKKSLDLKKEILSLYKFVLPISCIGAIIIFSMRDFIIETLFTSEFIPMRNLMPWQLLGDIMKIGSWVLAFIMVGRGMIKPYIATEIIFCILLYSLSVIMCQSYGITGSVMAYAVCYSMYWVVMIWIIRTELTKMEI
jgi:PST family polysaccharide transporter